MAGLTRFEDVDAWRKARELTRRVYELTSHGDYARDFPLKDQMRRATVSVMSNIAEGFERDGDKEFRQFLSLAKGPTGELKAQLYVALDAGFLSQPQFEELYGMATETGRLIAGFMRYLAHSNLKGLKFKSSSSDQKLGTRDQRPGARD